MYEQRDTFVPRKHHADYRDRGNWGTTKTRNVHVRKVVYGFNNIFNQMKILKGNNVVISFGLTLLNAALLIDIFILTWHCWINYCERKMNRQYFRLFEVSAIWNCRYIFFRDTNHYHTYLSWQRYMYYILKFNVASKPLNCKSLEGAINVKQRESTMSSTGGTRWREKHTLISIQTSSF